MTSSVWVGIVKLAAAALTYLMLLALSAALGPTEFGLFSSALAIGSLAGLGATFGCADLSVRTLPLLRDGDGSRSHFIRWVIVSTAGSSFATLFALFAASLLLPQSREVLLLGSVLVLPVAMSAMIAGFARANDWVIASVVPRDIVWRAATIGFALAVLLADDENSFRTAAATVAFSSAALFLVQAPVATRLRKVVEPRSTYDKATLVQNADSWRRSRLTLGSVSLFTLGQESLLPAAAGLGLSPEGAGEYFVYSRITAIAGLPLMAIGLAKGPTIVRSLGSREEVQGHLLTAVSRSAVASFIFAGILVTAQGPIVAIFGESYTSESAFRLLLLGQIATTLAGLTAHYFVLAGHEKMLAMILGPTSIVAFAGAVYAGKSFGIEGVATVQLVFAITWNFAAASWLWRSEGLDPSITAIARSRRSII